MANETAKLVLAVDAKQVKAATKDLEQFGKQGERTEKSLTGLVGVLRKLGTAASPAGLRNLETVLTRLGAKSTTASRELQRVTGQLTRIRSIGRISPQVDLTGISKATAELERLIAVSRRAASIRIAPQVSIPRVPVAPSAGGLSAAAGAGALSSGLGRGLGLISGGLVASEIRKAADSYSQLSARLRIATRDTGNFDQAQQDVIQIADRTRSSLESTADLYTKLTLTTKDLGATQAEVAKVTETVNQAIQLSGVSAASASASIVQLAQGLASNRLSGDELRSVLEQTPRLALAIADGLGVQIGKLRELGEAGQLTAERVFGALLRSSRQIKGEFDTLPATIGGAATRGANALQVLIGEVDNLSGASSSLTALLGEAARSILDLADDIRKLRSGDTSVNGLAVDIKRFVDGTRIEFAALELAGSTLLAIFGGLKRFLSEPISIQAITQAVQADVNRARREFEGFRRSILGQTGAGTAGAENDARRGRGFNRNAGFIEDQIQPLTVPGKTPRGGRSGSRDRVSEAQRYLESLAQQLQRTKDLTAVETVLADIQAGRLGKVTAAEREQALAIARQIDAADRLESQLKAEQAQVEEWAAARKRLADEGAQLFEETRTPAERLRAELERIARLFRESAISADTASRAQTNALIAWADAAERQGDAVDAAKESAEDLGRTFSSAAEDAIVNFNSLRDVIDGLARDLLRIGTRRLISEPLGNAASSFFEQLFRGGGSTGGGIGSFIASLFGGGRAAGGPTKRGRIYEINEGGRGPGEIATVGNRQFLLAARDGMIAPNNASGQSVVQHFNFAAPTDMRTQNQVAAAAARGLQLASLRNG